MNLYPLLRPLLFIGEAESPLPSELEVGPISRTPYWFLYKESEMSKSLTPKAPYPAQFREQMIELVRVGRKSDEPAKTFSCHVTSILSRIRQADAASGVMSPNRGR